MLRYTLLRKALNTNGVDTNLLEWPFALSSTPQADVSKGNPQLSAQPFDTASANTAEAYSGRTEWPHKAWFASADEIRANDFNLSAGRYRPMSQTAVEHRDPRELLDELAAIEVEIAEEVEALQQQRLFALKCQN